LSASAGLRSGVESSCVLKGGGALGAATSIEQLMANMKRVG
jgi:hypothetical protein